MKHLRHQERFLKHTLSIPFIYSVFFWFIILDILVEIYHRICFPLYWIELIDRNKYIKFDRMKLPYLSIVQKFNCAYCSYWNWLISYIKEIVAQTEMYWCWIQHESDPKFVAPEHHKDFLKYWDKEAFIREYWKKDCKLFE